MAKSKRPNATGAVYRNKKRGRWEASLVVGRRDDGRYIRRTFTGRTREIVEAKLDDARKALNQGLEIPDPRTTVDDFTTWWLDAVLPAEGLAPATEQWYRDVLNNYVVPEVGERTLTGRTALTPGDVKTMTGKLMAAGKSHRVAEAARTALGKVLRSAEQHGLVARNVARLSSPPKDRGKARTVKAFTVTEVSKLLAGLVPPEDDDGRRSDPSRWRPVVIVGVTTGLRPAELLALHWPDLTLTGNDPRVSVRHALNYVGGTSLKGPKRTRSYRTVPLAPEAVVALKDWRKRQAAERLSAGELWSDDWPDLVFTGEDGRPQRVDTFRHALRKALPGSHPHRLRHSYATHLLEDGVPIHHVAELLGDSVATVESTYSHVLRTKTEVAKVASGLLGGGVS